MQSKLTISVKDIDQKQHEFQVYSDSPVLDALIQLRKKKGQQVVMGEQNITYNRKPLDLYLTFEEQKVPNKSILAV